MDSLPWKAWWYLIIQMGKVSRPLETIPNVPREQKHARDTKMELPPEKKY